MKLLPAILLLCLPSCALLPRPAERPLPVIRSGPAESAELVVFLPGRWSRIEEFEREGFFEIASKRWPGASLVAADLHIGYYRNRSAPRALHEDVIMPAVRKGARHVRIVGVSMGGLGALMYHLEHPGVVDEIILLSPFVGNEEGWREIAAAGGVRRWRPGTVDEADFTRKLWLGLRERWILKERRPNVLLACGFQDRLAESNRRFAADFLQPGDVLWVEGGHDWQAWREQLRQLPAR